ncbi:MAG: PepSY-associated TM helix domain-containing protein [Paraglaciecola sp.]|uniref:PepSY-associated TM helix domain-containing protein n=1 Tax=Paraglaciecola sp. TaxID=1920173 RepID=UPI0032973701
MKQQKWFTLHHWAGFHLSLLMTFILLTGTFATISADLDWLANPAIRANQSVAQQQHLNWSALLYSVQTYRPQTQIDSIHRPHMPWHNVEVIARDTQGQRFRIYLDAYTHEITGQGTWFNWQRFFRQVHRHFMLPIKVGVTLVGIFALVLLFLLITSLYLYRNWWRYFFAFSRVKKAQQTKYPLKPQKRAAHKRRFWSELHKMAGLWSLWFIMVISLTGLWYLAEQWGAAASYSNFTPKDPATQSTPITRFSPQVLSRSIQYIADHNPEYLINQIRFLGKKGLIEIEGQAQAWLVRDRANKQVFEARTARWIDGRKGEELNWHFRISEAADPLHFGTFSSWAFRYIWFVFGLLLCSLSITGVYLYLLRLKQSGLLNTKTKTAKLVTLWNKSHWFKWPSVILLAITTYLVLEEFVF